MNRSFKDYSALPGRSLLLNHRRANNNNSLSREPPDDHRTLDLFSSRRTVSLSSDLPLPDDRTASAKLGKISVGSAKPAKTGLDDLLTSADGGKHDYDWLLTPPETPNFPSAEGNEFQQSFTAPRSSSAARSSSTTKPSRLSTTHVESNVSSRPARSSSVTRSAVSYSQNNSYSSMRSSSILNTSSASVSSYIRPSSPSTRARPSTPSARTTTSRPSTPSKARSAPTLSSTDKPRPSYGSRPSTPTSRTQISANSTSPSTLLSSRPSTPTRRSTISSSSSPGPNLSASLVRALSNNGRSQTSVSRPSSPGPRVRPQQPVIPPDFTHDTPPNLRTTMPDRPISAGRSRPAPAATAKSNTESLGHGSFPRRASSPAVTRGRSVEPKGRNHVHSNGYASEVQEPRKTSYVPPESPSRRNLRPSTNTADSNGFGRSISKKSLDMAIKHMDIRNGSGNMRPLAGTVLYPQSVRSATSKIQSTQSLNNAASRDLNGRFSAVENGFISENGKYANGALENGKREENSRLYGRLNDVDIFESSRYDAILLKEDLKNTNWLLSGDEKSDQGLLFDHGFESLPEPFGLS